jgi:IMP dehydrogenase
MKIRDVIKLTEQYGISGFPVVEGKEVVGIITNRDLRFEQELDAEVRAKMTPREKLVYVKEDADTTEAKRLMNKHRLERVLVVNDAFELRGLITVKDIQKSTSTPGLERLAGQAAGRRCRRRRRQG